MVMGLTVCSQHAVFYKLKPKFAPTYVYDDSFITRVYDINFVSLKNKNVDSKYKLYIFSCTLHNFLSNQICLSLLPLSSNNKT